jgi:arginyl-tRNA synthetase
MAEAFKAPDALIRETILSAAKKLGYPLTSADDIPVEKPKLAEHGDVASTVALTLARPLRRPPRQIAAELLAELKADSDLIESVEIAGPGYLNFRLGAPYWRLALEHILSQRENFGRATWGGGRRVQVEFVSANPTGPLNVVSARAATVGDVLVNLFNAVGFEAQREYYINDAGRQVRLLGASVSSRYMELLGHHEPFPEEGYHGDYVRDIAQEIVDREGDRYVSLPAEERHERLAQLALEKMIAAHQEMMRKFRVQFDVWFRESDLRKSQAHEKILSRLKEEGYAYEKDGAVWFASSRFGDEKDRVLVTRSGEPTYFLVDIAYHHSKYERGFEILHDLWGPDHHGYIPRMRAAIVALGYPEDSFLVHIIQQVNLLRGGEVVKMSKRAGKIIEMAELIDEVGVDVARFFFLTRRMETPLDFDIDLAKKTSEENPVYYVQYAHARICNILRFAEEQGVSLPREADLSLIGESAELDLIKKLTEYAEVVSAAARAYEPHRLPAYLQEVAAFFHRFYHHHRVVSEDAKLTAARLRLVDAARIVLANGLSLIGVSAPERM